MCSCYLYRWFGFHDVTNWVTFYKSPFEVVLISCVQLFPVHISCSYTHLSVYTQRRMYIRICTLNFFTRLLVLQSSSMVTIRFLILAASHFLWRWMWNTTGIRKIHLHHAVSSTMNLSLPCRTSHNQHLFFCSALCAVCKEEAAVVRVTMYNSSSRFC